jgi:hypothetical protein
LRISDLVGQETLCLDEICPIETISLDSAHIKCRFPLDVDCHALLPHWQDEETDPEFAAIDPKLTDPDDMIASVAQNSPVTVYKHGAATGHTTRNLMWIKEMHKWYQQARPSQPCDTGVKRDTTRAFYLAVKWLSPDQPFAEPGDSGSLVLVYVKHNNNGYCTTRDSSGI